MIALRCSDRAALDLSARIDLRCSELWQQLEDVQDELAFFTRPSGSLRYYETAGRVDDLLERERQILRELEDWS
jgi:hypothetical protein